MSAIGLKFLALWGVLTLTFSFPAQVIAAPEETITIATLLKGGWQIAGYTSTTDGRSAFIFSGIRTSRISCNAVQAMT